MAAAALVLARDVAGADPGARLAGLSLALRAVLSAQRAGAPRVVLVTSPGRAELARAVKADARVKVPVEHAEEVVATERMLLVRHAVVADASVYAALAAAALDGAAAVVACRDGAPLGVALVGAELLPALAADPDGVLASAVADERARPLATS